MPLLEELGYLGSFVNAVAMVGSVIYLALQVRQANKMARLSALDALRLDLAAASANPLQPL